MHQQFRAPVITCEALESRRLLAAVKIMPLGDSITESFTDSAGFRFWLWKQLKLDGYDVDFVSATESSVGDTYAAITARSFHSGGVNVLLMDGSVRFVRNTIALATWRAMGTRDTGEVVTID